MKHKQINLPETPVKFKDIIFEDENLIFNFSCDHNYANGLAHTCVYDYGNDYGYNYVYACYYGYDFGDHSSCAVVRKFGEKHLNMNGRKQMDLILTVLWSLG